MASDSEPLVIRSIKSTLYALVLVAVFAALAIASLLPEKKR